MAFTFVKKNGLLYTEDLKEIIGVDIETEEFTGKIPYGAVSIDDEVFTESPYEQIFVPESVHKLGAKLFADSQVLEQVKLPVSLKTLSPYLFSGCSSLKSIKMPLEVDSFPDGLFKNCSSLEEIPFRAGITELNKEVFAGCSSLKSLVIPSTVKRIESLAIADCESLKAVVFPAQLEYLAEDAFSGSENIRNIRIDGSNEKFFVNEQDGCLYERTSEGDVLRLKVIPLESMEVNFYKQNVDEETDDFFSDEDFDEIDETFSSEIQPEEMQQLGENTQTPEIQLNEEESMTLEESEKSQEELLDIEESEMENEAVPVEIGIAEEEKEMIMGEQGIDKNMASEEIDDVFTEIMNEQKERQDDTTSVAVSDSESQILAQMMEVMNDKPPVNDEMKVSDDELAKLFENNEEKFENDAKPKTPEDGVSAKTRILLRSAKFSQILDFSEQENAPADAELYVIAERVLTDENGKQEFTPKLIKCCSKFANIQAYKKVFLIYGLPFENEEFKQFYYNLMGQKNVILACEANCPANLSEYARTVCTNSRISLDHNELVEQRKQICEKNYGLVKLVIRDIYSK